jgi:hypothetical protein
MATGERTRREVRLDGESNAALEEELARRHLTFEAWLREKIAGDRDERERQERRAAVERLASMNIDLGYGEDEEDPVTRILNELADEDAARWDDVVG